ncbi:hypothetical protein MLD38_006398 [Melastoma candidum]|uniref:Uncharacterized protein n=1 Tax=Melastoma candidum TaxID=119954 RepID=A0ACB9RRH4_9MYRT|nr:hypothetical protein MLD38_006398 [Melastoma candidum]
MVSVVLFLQRRPLFLFLRTFIAFCWGTRIPLPSTLSSESAHSSLRQLSSPLHLHQQQLFLPCLSPLLPLPVSSLIEIMKSASCSLNPYATAYIPLSKREVADHTTKSFEKVEAPKDLKSSVEIHISETPFSSYAMVASASTSTHSADSTDDEFQMNLDCLLMMFPGLSYESLAAVYLENKQDTEATIAMLSQLESYIDEPLENLSETLDIGDIKDGASGSKLKNVEDDLVVPLSTGNSFPID